MALRAPSRPPAQPALPGSQHAGHGSMLDIDCLTCTAPVGDIKPNWLYVQISMECPFPRAMCLYEHLGSTVNGLYCNGACIVYMVSQGG